MKKLSFVAFAIGVLVSACQSKTVPGQILNNDAALPESHTISGKGMKVMASFINNKQHTMSTLYGNAAALKQLKAGAKSTPGEELTLITWQQKDDPHWFGAKIPGKVNSLETIKLIGNDGQIKVNYQRFNGPALQAVTDTGGNASRVAFILSQQPSVLP